MHSSEESSSVVTLWFCSISMLRRDVARTGAHSVLPGMVTVDNVVVNAAGRREGERRWGPRCSVLFAPNLSRAPFPISARN